MTQVSKWPKGLNPRGLFPELVSRLCCLSGRPLGCWLGCRTFPSSNVTDLRALDLAASESLDPGSCPATC